MTTTDATPVEVPDIGDFTDVPVIEILVSPGDSVQAEDPLVTLESDKATMDVPAPFAGTVKQLQVQIGDRVSEGSRLMTLEPAEKGASEPADQENAGSADEDRAQSEAEPARPDAETEGRAEPQQEQEQPESRAPEVPAAATDGATEKAPPTVASDGGGPVYASPSIRRLARELGVSLHSVKGTGRKGRITRQDVEAAASGEGESPAPGPGLGVELAPWPSVDFEKFG